MSYNSKATEADWRYPKSALYTAGHLDVASPAGHQIYWEEHGNPQGEPVLFVHGGPGGGTAAFMARYFDPKRYRIVLFDQRGCGKSKPSAADDDARPALTDNTTAHLIADMNKLREARGITGKMHVFGGSWGSTLSLAYAIAHPGNVASLILRGIFLCRRKDIDFFYQGNAATFENNPEDTRLAGTYMFFPEAWADFVRVIPEAERGDMVAAYDRIFSATPANDAALQRQIAAARAWSVWEGLTSYLAQDVSDTGKFADAKFAKAFARIENHYFMNGAFLGGSGGEANRVNNYLLENVAALKEIPVHIVHGRFDVVCPVFQADELVAALKRTGHTRIDYRRTPAGHSMTERENCLALTDIMDGLPAL
ncbi:MAG: proline iminopeptidase [Betaproteobacteria bacterium]|nr:proline iminopeptidase [Betaproteobacteria bacterium]